MNIPVKKFCIIGIAGLSLSGCGLLGTTPEPQPEPEILEIPVEPTRAAAVPTQAAPAPIVEEVEKPIRNWSTGHVPTGKSHTGGGSGFSGPSDSDEDGGWG